MRKKGISVECLSTEKAISTYNYLMEEGRVVAAALIPPNFITSYADQVIIYFIFFPLKLTFEDRETFPLPLVLNQPRHFDEKRLFVNICDKNMIYLLVVQWGKWWWVLFVAVFFWEGVGGYPNCWANHTYTTAANRIEAFSGTDSLLQFFQLL